jgi:DNA-binding Lrp family transcriptional regulator
VKGLDPFDKKILWELHHNCRISYQNLSRKLGISANAVKKRVKKLSDIGVIDSFTVILSPAMIGAEVLYAFVYTDGSENEKEFITTIGNNPLVFNVGFAVSGVGRVYNVYAQYTSSQDLSEIGRFLRQLHGVTQVEVHPLLPTADTKTKHIPPSGEISAINEFSKLHLRVLSVLVDDARIPISEIAARTNLTARRVRKIIQELLESGAVMFSVRWNLSAGGYDQFIIRIELDEKTINSLNLAVWLEEQFPREFWVVYHSASAPIVFATFVVLNLQEAEQISRRIKQTPFVKSTTLLVRFSETKFPWLGEIKLKELLKQEDL